VDPSVGDEMSQYALYWAMHFQRNYEGYRHQASSKHWQRHMTPLSNEYRVSVLGAGIIGSVVAERFALNGFVAQSWSRGRKELKNVRCFHGAEGLADILASTEVLVNCLPLKSSTRHLLNYQLLSQLPSGSSFINISRGEVVDDQALINLLDAGHIANAALDTFAQEPLPEESDLWGRENVYITPHMSGSTYPRLACEVIANNIKRIEKGEEPFPIYKRETG